MSEALSVRDLIARAIYANDFDIPAEELEEQWAWSGAKQSYQSNADAVLAVLADPPAYLALDLWMALGLSSRDFDAYLERNGWADTWANLLDGVRRNSGRRGCSKDTETPREQCVLIAGHVGPCMGASDVGSSERLPGAAFGGEQE